MNSINQKMFLKFPSTSFHSRSPEDSFKSRKPNSNPTNVAHFTRFELSITNEALKGTSNQKTFEAICFLL